MLTSTTSGTSTSYQYDGDGIRTAKTTGSTATSYLWDRESGLPQLVDDGTQSYLGDGDDRQQTDRAGNTTSLLPDALGSVRGLASGTSGLAGSADYDVFGALRASSGSTSTFGFAGEQTDPETGLSFLRARYYSPIIGRFFSADSISPNAPGTQGYNPYAYTANNPATWTDPSGHGGGPAVSLPPLPDVYYKAWPDGLPGIDAPPLESVTAVGSETVENYSLVEGCELSPPCVGVLAAGAAILLRAAAYVAVVALVYVAAALVACGLDVHVSYSPLPDGFGWSTSSCMQRVNLVLRWIKTYGYPGRSPSHRSHRSHPR